MNYLILSYLIIGLIVTVAYIVIMRGQSKEHK